jgi:outer membrane protein TolC
LSRTHQAEQALQASHYNLETERTEARRKVLENTSQIAALRESLQAKRQREAESIRTRDLYRLQYLELGSRSFSDLLSAESEIHQTRIDILSALAKAVNAEDLFRLAMEQYLQRAHAHPHDLCPCQMLKLRTTDQNT